MSLEHVAASERHFTADPRLRSAGLEGSSAPSRGSTTTQRAAGCGHPGTQRADRGGERPDSAPRAGANSGDGGQPGL